ncbi:prenyltransferase [Streptomyces avermitilis]|uniref:prenyltransferase n=1 Tax=Streptomyces avermitilis TaxID=33903 RepID=UPI0033B19A9E
MTSAQAAPGARQPTPADWIVASGPPLLLVVVLQGTYAISAAHHSGDLSAWRVALTLLVLVPDCAGRRFINDYEDYVRGLDRPDGVRPQSSLALGLDMRRLRTVGLACFGVAWAGLAVLAITTSLWLLPLIALCYLAYFSYAGGPRPLGHRAMGELLDFVVTGTGVTLILAWLNVGHVDGTIVLASLGPGFLFAGLMLHNNARDVDKDRAAGKTTLPHVVSPAVTKTLYACCLIGFYLVVLALALRLDSAAVLLPAVTLPWAAALVWSVSRSRIGPEMISWAWLYHLMITDFVLFSVGAWL